MAAGVVSDARYATMKHNDHNDDAEDDDDEARCERRRRTLCGLLAGRRISALWNRNGNQHDILPEELATRDKLSTRAAWPATGNRT